MMRMDATGEKRGWGGPAWPGRVLALGFFAVCLAGPGRPATAGELRAILEGEAAVTSDGNYGQSETLKDADSQMVGRGGLALRLSYDMKRSALALVYSPSYEESLDSQNGQDGQDGRSRSGFAQRLLFGFQGSLTRRTDISIQERLFSSPSLDLYVPPTSPDTRAVTRRGDQLSNDLSVSVRQALTRRTGMTAGLNHSLRTFENSDLFDTESYGADLGWNVNLDRDRSFGLSGGLGKFQFEDGRDSDVRLANVYYAFLLGRRTQVRLDAGAFWLEGVNFVALVPEAPEPLPGEEVPPGPLEPVLVPVDEKDNGWRGGVQLSQQTDFVNWSLGYRHDISAGYGLGRAAETDNAFLGLSRALGRTVTLGVDGSASRQRDLRQFAELRGTDKPLSELITGTARLSWEILPALRLTGGYSRVWQQSRIEQFDDLSYSRYFLGLAFRLWSTGDTPKNPLRPAEDPKTEGGEGEKASGEDNP
jgi:hypothetical protein